MKWGLVMYLHKDDRDLFQDMVSITSETLSLPIQIVEKDYYVTVILRLLAESNDNVVFKGGTSLSKAYHVIDRFSEDVDITFTEHLGEGKRKTLKYKIMKKISEELSLPILNWNRIESDKNYNHYDYSYNPVDSVTSLLTPYVKVETALMGYAFPTEEKMITNLIYQVFHDSNRELLEHAGLMPFTIKVQALSRTLIDKMFALCDYYMLNKASRNSRHLYDIYKLSEVVQMDDSFRTLISRVRTQRAQMSEKTAPSARKYGNIRDISNKIVSSGFYRKDYEEQTSMLLSQQIPYDRVILRYDKLMKRWF